MDVDFAAFFKQNAHHLQNTIVIVVADHGNRYSAIRDTVRLHTLISMATIFFFCL